ncbi:hypothetical protein BCR34DRAFT_553138 [Clohesyomyces aquaticus]|uniref:pyridoxal 5'-phosphate synthase n=1 Tax=Clohesyomyces aquaticus TaxID=1231657 RepID=A0A1Y2A931_9PLEO|nr:hypothetical protein BCR34DRAFT_553138 [Clohesyomyces aquaticus]
MNIRVHLASKTLRLRPNRRIRSPIHTNNTTIGFNPSRRSELHQYNSLSPNRAYGMLYSAKNTVLGREPDSAPSTSGTSTPSKRIFAPTGGSDTPGQAVQYAHGTLELSDLAASPLDQFHAWFEQAKTANVYQPETVTLATASLPDGKVSARIVFMKELDERGFVVYSNWGTSRKSADIRSNPQAAMTFWWREVERQIRVEGTVERLSGEEGQLYYDTRIRGSRVGAWASPQSQVLSGREELEQRVKDVEKRFEGQDSIPIPDFWGGLRIVPDTIEFWQGRQSRLHDRFQYTRVGENGTEGEWKIERLSP